MENIHTHSSIVLNLFRNPQLKSDRDEGVFARGREVGGRSKMLIDGTAG